MYGNQNNVARIFQIHHEIANLHQDDRPFVQLLGNLKSLWNELEMYCPYTINVDVLQKKNRKYQNFQLLASPNPNFKDIQSNILMKLPSLKFVCATIQGEEIRRKVMSLDTNYETANTRVYHAKAMSRSENSGMFDYHFLPQ